jgi:hypothetical protein
MRRWMTLPNLPLAPASATDVTIESIVSVRRSPERCHPSRLTAGRRLVVCRPSKLFR